MEEVDRVQLYYYEDDDDDPSLACLLAHLLI